LEWLEECRKSYKIGVRIGKTNLDEGHKRTCEPNAGSFCGKFRGLSFNM
jgi:hypothetical protein